MYLRIYLECIVFLPIQKLDSFWAPKVFGGIKTFPHVTARLSYTFKIPNFKYCNQAFKRNK